MFVNYFADDERALPINLAVARVLVSAYLLWKLVSIDWQDIYAWPVGMPQDLTSYLLVPESVLIAEVGIAGLLLVLFAVGYRTLWVGVGAALIVMHLTGVRMLLTASGDTVGLLVAAYFTLFIALFSEHDRISVDAIRHTSEKSIDELNTHLQSDGERDTTAAMPALKYSLLVMGILYFFSLLAKAIRGPLHEWVRGDNLGLFIATRVHLAGFERPLVNLVLESPLLLWAGSIGTVILEAGFLIAILAGVTLWPFILGLVGMHTVIALSVGPFFLDQMLLFGLFVAWDRGYAWLARDDSLDIVYDEHCYFCNQSLYLFPYLDVNDTVTFYSQYTVPSEFQNYDDVDFEAAMYAFRDGEAHEGYWAFRELLRQFGAFALLVWLMGRAPVAAVGERVYRYIADNRSRHFTCRIDAGPD